jgi:4-amino-4-deoxy-L-arabinose transferase-like glycosyltransferase
MAVGQKRSFWLVISILLLGSALRMVALEQSPPGFSLDEACEAYDAYSLWHTGRDQHGVLFPTVLQSFNDYRMPLFMYSMAPMVGMAGLSVTTARLTSAFWSILAIAAIYWVGVQMFGRTAALVAAFFLAISPWHVQQSRIAYEPNATVLAATLVVGMLWRWRRTGQNRWLLRATFASGLAIYTYVIMKPFIPLLVVLLGLLFWQTLLAHRRQVLIAVSIGVLLAFPAFYDTFCQPDVTQSRYRQVAVFRPGRSLSEASFDVIRNIQGDLSPRFLVGSGNLVRNPESIKKLYPAQALVILFGIVWGVRKRESRLPTVAMILWILAGILPVALTARTSHEHRLLPIVPPYQLLSGLGMASLVSILDRRPVKFAIVLATAAWVGANAIGYYDYYFTQFPGDLPDHLYDVGIAEAIVEMDGLDDDYGAVYFNCFANAFPYIDVLFYTRYDPHLLQVDLPVWEDDSSVRRVGKYYFVCDTEAMWSSGLPGLYVVPGDELPDVDPLAITTYASGAPRFRIVGRKDSFINGSGWLSQCTKPAVPLDTELVARASRRDFLRQNDFDCTSAWLYPTGGTTVGTYVIHHSLATQAVSSPGQIIDPFIARHLAGARLVWETRDSAKELGPFVAYAEESAPVLPTSTSIPVLSASAEPTTATLSLATPIPLAGPLTFLGATAYPDDDGLEIETWWGVVEGPITRPFSVMAHLIAETGEILGTADGLGVWPMTLLPQDIIVQRHRFPDPPLGVRTWLRTGVYWLDTKERWLVLGVSGADAFFVSLGTDGRDSGLY